MPRGRSLFHFIILVVAVIAPLILRSNYLRELLVMSCIFAILALSFDIITGYMGQLSFGHSAFFGIGAYAAALIPLRLGWSDWIGILAAIFFSSLFGVLIGYISLKRTRGMYLAIVTFGFGWVLYVIASNWFSLTRGPTGLFGIPAPVVDLPFVPRFKIYSNLSYYYLCLILLLIVLYLIDSMLRSRFGRALITIRENEDLARSIGVNPQKYCVIAFTFATALAGFAGAIYTYHIRTISPGLLSMSYMIMVVVMVVIGGMVTLGGPIVGALIYIWGSELLRFSGSLRFFFLGAIVVVAIIFMPRGVYRSLITLVDWVITRFQKYSNET